MECSPLDKLTPLRKRELRLAIIGLGYVGLPLAVEFGKQFDTIGFDVKAARLEALKAGVDRTLEVAGEELATASRLRYTGNPEDLRECDVFIVTVPTPVDKYNRPDLTPLLCASETVGAVMRPGSVVIYESTVYPGCTEEECVPVLERASGLTFNQGFFCGYSPERINPGDKEHTLLKIRKITSGSTPETAELVDALYKAILQNGTHRASSLKVAEAAKVIENSQRDLNIAFVNELAKIFRLIGIDTNEVLEAAGTKWNFLRFKPGLVGGHCIGVDPYYLTHKAQALGYLPEVILAGRRINDGMGKYVASEIVKLMIRRGGRVLHAQVLQLGLTFKENCPDIRNSHAVDVVRGLQEFGCDVDVHDPWASPDEVQREYGLRSVDSLARLAGHRYDAIVLAVAHRQFADLDLSEWKSDDAVVFDIKGFLPREQVDGRL
ncbi:MAG: nucleotide sugar dehydrogenase [Victivallales bacterium]|nr:nucleotide sugar dehydrogenase [Victivallales bacterium]